VQAFAHVLRGQALVFQKRAQEAEKAWAQAGKLDPSGAGQQLADARFQIAKISGLMTVEPGRA
jgi:predicted negative regulator of RcsB-dependent stress response